MEVKVEGSRDGENYMLFNEYEGFLAEKGKLAWAEIDLQTVKAQYFQTTQYQDGENGGEVNLEDKQQARISLF